MPVLDDRACDPGHDPADLARLAFQRIAQEEGRHAGFPCHRGRGLEGSPAAWRS